MPRQTKPRSARGAAVIVQPPCRAMLASDACQKDPSKIATIIPLNSPMARELEKVGDGDFIVVSGKILYAALASPSEASSTHAVYEAGSYCSKAGGAKTERCVCQRDHLSGAVEIDRTGQLIRKVQFPYQS
jgi:hypothetical protein